MAKLSSTHIYGDLYVDGTISGALSGNASTATKLQTGRTINGTSFNGSSNITTANWGTSRTITIGNTGKSVNGSGNVSWTLAEIGAAASSHGTHVSYGGNGSASTVSRSDHTHSYLPLSGGTMTGNITFTGVTSTTYPAKSNTLTWSGSTDGADIYYQVDASDKGRLVLNTKDDADCIIAFANNGAVKTTIDNSGNFSGKAATAGTSDSSKVLNQNTKMDYGWNGLNYFNIDGTAGNAAKVNDTPTSAWWHIIRCNHANSSGYYTDVAVPFNATSMYYKRIASGAVQNNGWVKILDSLNWSDYAAAKSHGTHLTLGTGSGNAYRGDYGNTAYKHSQAAHAPTNAQKNSDITKAEIEAKLTGNITSHTHSYLPLTGGTLSGRLHADGKLSVRARGGSWIDTVNFDNVAIANNTEPSNGAYYPLLAARTEGMHTMSLGSNYTGFGFYGFKNGRTENGVDLQFSLDVANHTMYTNAWSTFDNGMDVTGEINASLFRPKYAPGSQNCYISGGNGDAANWDTHNMVIRSHWGIGFRDYQDICRIVMDTRAGSISSQGNLYSGGQLLSEAGLYTNGTVTSAGNITANSDLVCNGRAWIYNATLSGMFIGEHKFSVDGAYADPWEGTGCAIKAYGNVGLTGTLRTNSGIYSTSGNGVTPPDGATYAALLRYKDSRGYCDLGNNNIPGRLYIRSGQGTAGSGVLVECRVTDGNAYMQYLSPEAGTIALTRHLSDRTRKDNIVYVDSKDSEFTNKDFYDFIKNDLGLATYNLKKEYASTDTHTKLNFIAQDILWDFEKNEENKVGNLIVQAEDAMDQQLSLKYDPEVFTSVIAGALKESINKIEELEDKNKKLEERLVMLEEKFSALENK